MDIRVERRRVQYAVIRAQFVKKDIILIQEEKIKAFANHVSYLLLEI